MQESWPADKIRFGRSVIDKSVFKNVFFFQPTWMASVPAWQAVFLWYLLGLVLIELAGLVAFIFVVGIVGVAGFVLSVAVIQLGYAVVVGIGACNAIRVAQVKNLMDGHGRRYWPKYLFLSVLVVVGLRQITQVTMLTLMATGIVDS